VWLEVPWSLTIAKLHSCLPCPLLLLIGNKPPVMKMPRKTLTSPDDAKHLQDWTIADVAAAVVTELLWLLSLSLKHCCGYCRRH
jgi:hypothetical protein